MARVAVATKMQFSIKTLLLLILFVALSLRHYIVIQRFNALLIETSSGKTGREASELKTKLGYLPPDDFQFQCFVPIPPIGGNSRRFRLYLPKCEGKRILKLGMTNGSSRYSVPLKNADWPLTQEFLLSDSEKQVISVAWLKSSGGTWIIRIERDNFIYQDVEFTDSDFLESPKDWKVVLSDFQALKHAERSRSFDLWELHAFKNASSRSDLGVVSGFRLWIEHQK